MPVFARSGLLVFVVSFSLRLECTSPPGVRSGGNDITVQKICFTCFLSTYRAGPEQTPLLELVVTQQRARRCATVGREARPDREARVRRTAGKVDSDRSAERSGCRYVSDADRDR